MTLNADQWRELCGRRDAGVVAAARGALAAKLLAGTTEGERQALIDDGRSARQDMIEANLGLVRFAVARYLPTAGLDRDDYFQEGVLGLAVAVDRYDPARSDQFSSFALPHIRGAVSTLVGTRGGDLRQAQARAALQIQREMTRLESIGRSTGTRDVATSLQVNEQTVVAALSYRRPVALTSEGEPPGLPDPARSNSDRAPSPPAARMLFMLPPRERSALEAVHDDANAGRTWADIAGGLGLSTRQLRAVVESGHRHLRALLAKTDPELTLRPQGARPCPERAQPLPRKGVDQAPRR